MTHDSLEKRAEELIKGMQVFHNGRLIEGTASVFAIYQALLETAEKAERESIKRCVDIANNEIETFRMIRRDGGPAEIVRNQILKFLDPKQGE